MKFIKLLAVGILLIFSTGAASSNDIHTYLYSDIEMNPEFFLLIKQLNQAKKHETVIIHINTRGGSASVMLSIVKAIHTTKATVITINEGLAASAGAIIGIQGDVIVARPGSRYMFHLGRYTNDDGKIVKLPVYHPLNIIVLGLIHKEKILTPSEFRRVKALEDVWIPGEVINARTLGKASTSEVAYGT